MSAKKLTKPKPKKDVKVKQQEKAKLKAEVKAEEEKEKLKAEVKAELEAEVRTETEAKVEEEAKKFREEAEKTEKDKVETLEPKIKNPDMVEDTKIPEGSKNIPATGLPNVYTYKGYKKLIDRYWEENEDMEERNPAKYKAKKSELETNLAKLK